MVETLLPRGKTYEEVYARFRWQVPECFNIAVAVCDRHAGDPTRLAMIYEDEAGRVSEHSFAEFRARSNQLARALARLGVARGDRVGVVLSQRPETAVAHLAAYKLGAIALPLSTLFGPEALAYRLRDAEARVVITDAESLDRVLGVRPELPALQHVIGVDAAEAEGVLDYRRLLAAEPDAFDPVATAAEEPALLIYTSGTTGPPKGALHAHRMLIGHLPAIEFYHEYFPQPGDRFWTPADWAWIGGLYDVLFPSWYYGVAVVAHRMRKFDPEQALALMARHRVRNAFLVPTALKMLRQVANPRRYGVKLRTLFTGGEPVGEEVIRWAQEELGVTPHEGYGQTEVNLVLGNCSLLLPVKPGSMGRPVPGHVVEVLDEKGQPVAAGELGEVAVRRPDPVMFLGYWHQPQATAEKFCGDWALTGDLARKDAEGYFWFVGRKDDIISSGGYRIGPGEIEDCLAGHSAVAMAAVVGSPDPVRGEVVKAFVQLRPGVSPSPALARELAEYVRTRLSAHEYPREIEFVDALPMTTTGKVRRRDLRELERRRKLGEIEASRGSPEGI
ncbi:MAG: AMP-dependent synthetase [Candidatus Tectimicrobiota bacterium]|nr:MAG: AMP-dependent synthetase [Candidatus Tectomicrobia bacterium]